MDPRLSPPGGPVAGGEMIIFEGHLEKMSEILSKWERRYFVLSRTNLFDPASIELAYYKDSEKKAKQKKTIDLSSVSNVSPVQKSGNKEYMFALELTGKHLLLRSSSSLLQNVWLAKLLECCSKDHLTYHVTVPAQPMSSYMEGLIKLAAPAQVTIVSPINGAKLVTIDFDKIRRFGCEVLVDYDIVWFETCNCKGAMEQFFWFSVPSGIETAQVIIQDIKKSIELTVRSFLIQEEGNKNPCQTMYISRPHYGCNEYPNSMKQRILQSSLMSLATAPRCEAASLVNRIERTRRSSGAVSLGEAPTPGGDSRRVSEGSRQASRTSLAPGKLSLGELSPRHNSSSPTYPEGNKKPLSQIKYYKDLSKSVGHGEFDSGVNMDGHDPSRHSAPSTYNVMDAPSKKEKISLHNMGKRQSMDETRTRTHIQQPRRAGTANGKLGVSLGGGRRLSDFTVPNKSQGGASRRLSEMSQGRDSANGSVGDLLENSGGYNLLESEEDRYNHLAPENSAYSCKSLPGRSQKNNAYDHLSEALGGMSLSNSLSKKQKSAYVMS